MADLPKPGVYVGGPTISPVWLVGRKIIVRRVIRWRDLVRLTGHRDVAATDDDLRRGWPMPEKRDPNQPIEIDARTLVRGKVRDVTIRVERWDGVPA